MAVSLNQQTYNLSSGGAGSGTATFSHTVSGSDKVLTLIIRTLPSIATLIVSGVTYNGVAMTLGVSATNSDPGGSNTVQIWYLLNPPSTTANVAISYTAVGFFQFLSVAATWNGCDVSAIAGTYSDSPGTPLTTTVGVGLVGAVADGAIMCAMTITNTDPANYTWTDTLFTTTDVPGRWWRPMYRLFGSTSAVMRYVRTDGGSWNKPAVAALSLSPAAPSDVSHLFNLT